MGPIADTASTASATKRRRARDRLLALREELAVGAALPPERRLAEELGVSRPTLRSALDQLVAEGLLSRRQGSGTFVSQPKVAQPLTLTSFSEDMRRRGMRAGSRVLAFGLQPATDDVAEALGVTSRAPVWAVRRLRLADDEPMAIEDMQVPQAVLPRLSASDLEGRSFYDHLRAHGVELGVGMQAIEPGTTDELESRLLHVAVSSPVFRLERVTHSRHGEPVELVRSVYRGDRYRLLAELRPPLA